MLLFQSRTCQHLGAGATKRECGGGIACLIPFPDQSMTWLARLPVPAGPAFRLRALDRPGIGKKGCHVCAACPAPA